jgi:uncharacterized protein (TIGR02145 family)
MKPLSKILAICFIFSIWSCAKEYHNPYDRSCPSDIWTPYDLNASSSENGIMISWQQNEKHFDGFILEWSTDSVEWQKLAASLIDKTVRNFTDTSIPIGEIVYFRIYAIADRNQSNYSYSSVYKSDYPNCGTVTDFDGNIYTTVSIGTQCWFRENLRTTKFRNGNPIPYWTRTSTKGYCWYDDDVGNKYDYGAIYHHQMIDDKRGLCPAGWHIPSLKEWETLSHYLGGDSEAGGKLKESGTINWVSPNMGATNSTGFSALPGGYKNCGNDYVSLGFYCGFWTSQPEVQGRALSVHMNHNSSSLFLYDEGGLGGFTCNGSYVRCIKD